MSKYKRYTVKLRMAHYISYSLFDSALLLGNGLSGDGLSGNGPSGDVEGELRR